VDIERVKSKSRVREYVWARQVYYWLSCKFTKQKLIFIGRLTSGRDHTTVIHGRELVSDIIKFDKNKEREVREIAGVIKNIGKTIVGDETQIMA
jgi:chromosomal replication initiator protein